MGNDFVLPPIPTGQEIEAQRDQRKYDRLSKFRLDPTQLYEEPQFSFAFKDGKFAPRGDLCAIVGGSKSGKSFFASLLIGTALKGCCENLRCLIEKPKVLIIDTEMHRRNVSINYRRICWIGGRDGHRKHDQLSVLCLRGETPDSINDSVILEVERFQPDIVILDGIADCVLDPNNLSESKEIISDYLKMALEFNVAVFAVIHTNFESSKMRGHLGTELERKCADTFRVSRVEDGGKSYFVAEQTISRNAPVEKISFSIENRIESKNDMIAVPILCDSVTNSKPDENENDLASLFKSAFAEKPLLSRSDLKDAIKRSIKRSERSAYVLIRKAEEAGIICKDSVSGKLHFIGGEHPPDGEIELPF